MNQTFQKANKFFRLLILSIVFIAISAMSYAQQTVTGTIIGQDNNEPMPGVNVAVKGTAIGTTTDVKGSYTLNVPPGSSLQFSFIGYATQEVNVGNQSQINIVLVADIKTLNEVVVIGYGEREKKDLTGAISNVTSEEISKSTSMTPELAMQGRMAGVFVGSNGGNPNARPTVLIRGKNTFNYSDPLYVVDGIPITEGGTGAVDNIGTDLRGNVNILTLINPNDIESMTVLKDASSAAIYGVRAANGVVLITTKKGKKGRMKLDFTSSVGIQNIPKTIDLLNTQQYSKLYQEAYGNNPTSGKTISDIFGPAHNPASPSYLGNGKTYDWQNELKNKNATIQDYSLKVSGGNDNSTYYVSAGYSKTESPLKGNNLERYSLAANMTNKISRIVESGVNIRIAYNNALDNTQGDLSGTLTTPPWQPIYDPNDPSGFAASTTHIFKDNPDLKNTGPIVVQPTPNPLKVDSVTTYNYGLATKGNPLANQSLNQVDYHVFRTLGNVYLQIEPIKGLKFKGTLSGDFNYNRNNSWSAFDAYRFSQTPGNPYSGNNGTSKGSYGERHSRNTNLVKEFTINYNHSFGDHNFDLLLNAMDQKYNFEVVGASSGQVNFLDPSYRNVVSSPPFSNGSTYRRPYTLQGYMARLSYKYQDRYYLDVTVRRDGSSRFAPDYRWGIFPSISGAWRLSSESFMKDITFINDLKLRGGWGELGNQETTVGFAYLSVANNNAQASFGSGSGNPYGNNNIGSRLPNFPNKTLTWERVKTSNIAIDALFLNKSVSLTLEYYNKVTKGIIQQVNLPGSSGIEDQADLNVADVKNRGLEIQLGYNKSIRDFTFNISGNITTVKNTVLATYNNTPFFDKNNGNLRIKTDYSMGYIYGYKVGGIFHNQGEVDAWKVKYKDQIASLAPMPGDLYFQNINGAKVDDAAKDTTINTNDRTYLGKTIPGYYYGINLGASYKGIDLSVFFQGVGDVQKINGFRNGGEDMASNGNNQWTSTLNRWTPTNTTSNMPRAVFGDPNGNNRFSDRWVENAGFLRLKNIQLGYSIPTQLLSKTKVVERVRIYLSSTNLMTWTKWKGLDPENDYVPPTKQFLVGLNATF